MIKALFFAILSVTSVLATAPQVIDTDPTPDTEINELTTLAVVFDQSVSGVDANDLLINNVPASSYVQISPREYTFGFPQPANGTVNIRWAPNPGISALDGTSESFAGGSWTYTLNTAPPPPTVVISEFMADNGNGIKDDDGKRSDWIELFNMGLLPVSLDGWSLSVDPSKPTQWRIPAVTLNANSYLLIWASEKNRTNPAAQLHTNFKLSKEGGYLGLFDSKSNPVSEFRPAYPVQQSNISYGRDSVDPALTGYFSSPTPRGRNLNSGLGFAAEPVFSREGGVVTNTSISISLAAPAGQIRYTVDGSPPTSNSFLYTGALTITTSTTLKARTYQNGLLPSPIVAKNYLLLDGTVSTFTSNLPLMIFSTSGHGIADHVPSGQPRTFASLAAIDTFRGRSSPLGTADYFGQCELGIRGQTSAGFPKKPYRLELQDAYRTDLNASFFGLPEGSDWVLNNPYSDKPFLQNFLAQELFEKMGHYAVRRRFVEVFVNTSGGRITYPRDYAGIYILLEKIKVDDNRVEIPKLTPYDISEPNISGGYMFKKDKDSAGDLNFSTVGGAGFTPQALKIHEPSPATITSAQVSWIRNYLIQFEKALYAPGWLSAKGTNHYSYYIDSDSFVDYQWIVEYSKQIDGYRLSNYMSKDRNGKVKMEPIWDWNLSFGNADYADGFNTSGWYYSGVGENDHLWFHRLMFGTTSPSGTTGDPDFNQKITDRWSVLRTNIFASSNVLARVDELAGILSEAAARDFKKWPRLGTYIWPNPGFYVTPTTYPGIITAMKTWISGRYNWIDTQFPRSPLLGLNSGRIAPGSRLSITNSGPLYYTLDGSDPRLPGGSISTNAFLYSGPITLLSNVHLIARGKTGTKWSGPAAASYIITTPSLIVSELMYHPSAPPAGSLYTEEDFEFIELKNSGNSTLDLMGYRFTHGIDFTFPALTAIPGQRILLVKNRNAFESRYGAGLPIAGEYAGSLDNGGERLTLVTLAGDIVLDFSYQDTWQPITDGAGFSLVLADENISAQLSTQPDEWHTSGSFGGTPGSAEGTIQTFPKIVVNELWSHPQTNSPDRVELQNLSPDTASIGGWFLTDDFNNPKKYRIPNGTIIGPGSFFTLSSSDFATNNLTAFGFSSLGESVYVFSGDVSTNLTGYVHGYAFGAQKEGVSFGRYVDSTGSEHFVAQSANSFAATNARPLVPSVILNEIMYHPSDLLLNGSPWNDTEDEYIELYNRTDQPLPLFDSNNPTNRWKITGGVEFTFPTDTSLAAKSYLIVVSFDPATNPAQASIFRNKYSLSTGVVLTGPFSGHLGNTKETISLMLPDAPVKNSDGSTTVPYILAESLSYSSDLPGFEGADGFGFSLNRRDPAQFADDPANWFTCVPNPGSASPVNAALAITTQPLSQNVLASQTISLQVSANSVEPLFYQWRRDGVNIPGGTNNTLVITNAQLLQTGSYSAIVFGTSGSVSSKPAQVTVDLDSDQDGIPDSWEIAHGSNPFDPSDRNSDTDGDWVSNRDEYIAGTNPRNFASNLKISYPTTQSISFTAMPNRFYVVESSENISPASWSPIAHIPARAQGGYVEIEIPQTDESHYYRIAVSTAP